ncbi:ABC transporter ATP-binding protein [Mailhella sp.]|uniref:ABC transporter ATP-binding protein n=1 Tax=Mailhella sp. TaxID=1981029 RepID=UPI004062E046
MVIELKNIVKRFGQNTVVNHVDLTIGDGEFFTLLGPSGCGKTTLLRMIAGFNDPDEGDILFGGESILHLPAHKRDTGMVFQNYALFPHLSVEENVAYGLRARGIKGQEVKDRVKDILEAVQLGDMASRYPRQLSGGQQQRVALARALVIRPRVLLMDEPLSNLDAKLRVSMREEIRRIQQNLGITTVYVTHDQEEAMAVSDRIAIFYAGHLQQVASPAAIYFTPANRFTAEFMGSCNILETQCVAFDAASETARAVSGGVEFTFRAKDAVAGESLPIMLRPDWIELASADSVNRFPGVVRERMFLGDSIVYQVEALGRTLRVDMSSVNHGHMLEIGEAVELAFAPESPVTVRK